MLSFMIRRIGIAIPTMLILITFSFLMMHAAPGGPFNSERMPPPEVLANLEAKYGLDKPLFVQLAEYIWNVVTRFDFGPSFKFKDRTVNDIIAQGFPVTLTYGFWSFVVAVTVGVSLGAAGSSACRSVIVLLMSVGEAMWQPRFLQWIAEIAPSTASRS